MADENEDQWLYGDSVDGKECSDPIPNSILEGNETSFDPQEESSILDNEGNVENGNSMAHSEELGGLVDESQSHLNESNVDETGVNENGTKDNSNQEDGEAASDSDSDDDVHVVIGDIKSTPAYSSINIKRGGLLTSGGVPEKINKQPGKFSIDEFETIGVINGIPAHEFNLDQLEDKPWRQPGADITDYFNYGFNEETWRAYCERQKRMRSESGVGLILNAGSGGGNTGGPGSRVPQVTITNYNSKYSGIMGPKRAGPPPGRKMAGTIDVIGSTGLASRRNLDKSPPKENVIQVMTADRREYSRKPGFPDMSVPPPVTMPPPFDMPPPGYPEPVPYFVPEVDPYYQSYEPTQDRQWGNDPTWQPTNLAVPLTGGDDKEDGPKSIPTMVPPVSMPPMMSGRDQREGRDRDRDRDRERELESVGRDRERERDRDRERDREREKESMVRDRDREKESVARDEDRERDRARSQYRHKERHRHRSRSRSRRHKSRSRSPNRRKKKSRRSERERSKEESE